MQINCAGSNTAEFTSLLEPDVLFLQPSLWIVVIQPTSATTKPNLLASQLCWLLSSFRISRVLYDGNLLSPAYLRLDSVLFPRSLPRSLSTFHSHLGAEY